MLKYLLIVLVIITTSLKSHGQTVNDPARDEFIEMMNQQAKNEKDLQQRAQFKGGPGALYDYLQSHIIYPEKAKQGRTISTSICVILYRL